MEIYPVGVTIPKGYFYNVDLSLITFHFSNKQFEKIHCIITVHCNCTIALCGMAGVAAHIFNLRCVDTITLARKRDTEQETIFRLHISYDVRMEHRHHVVDLECITTGGRSSILRQ